MILMGLFITLQSLGCCFILALHHIVIGLAYMPLILKLCAAMTLIPYTSAAPQTQSFPDVPFYVFSEFIEQTFNSKVSLATVLLVLFSLTENPKLLSLHACQQHPECKGKNKTVASGWM